MPSGGMRGIGPGFRGFSTGEEGAGLVSDSLRSTGLLQLEICCGDFLTSWFFSHGVGASDLGGAMSRDGIVGGGYGGSVGPMARRGGAVMMFARDAMSLLDCFLTGGIGFACFTPPGIGATRVGG